MPRSTLFADFLAFVRERGLFAKGERVLAACSGGPDSVALLDCLKRSSRGRRIELSACHLDHCLRGEDSAEDARFVEALCAKMGVALTVARKDVARLAKRKGLSIEAAARKARYDFFLATARKTGATAVATAHTLSDNAETVLQRLIEGAGPEGLSGIPAERALDSRGRVRVVRPLLFATRTEIEAYLAGRGLESRLDRTNLEPIYLRNRIRLEVLPQLREINPSIERALARAGELTGALLDFVRGAVEEARSRIVEKARKGAAVLGRGALAEAHPYAAAEAVKEALLRAGVEPRALKAAHVEAVVALARGRKPSAAVELPGGVVARRDYERILIEQRAAKKRRGRRFPSRFEKALAAPGKVRLPGGLGTIEAKAPERFDFPAFLRAKMRFEEAIDAAKVKGALFVRFTRPGERFRPLGAPGARKLKEFFIDAKVPEAARPRTPVVADRKGIVWVAGQRIAERVKATGRTKRFLRLTWKPGARIE